MSKLEEFKNNQRIKQYFKDELAFSDDEEFERRLQLYLEIFPFIAVDFRLKNDCAAIHRSAKILTQTPTGAISNSKIQSTNEIETSYPAKAVSYRKALLETRESLDLSEIEINLDEV